MLDGDLLFQASPQPLLDHLGKHQRQFLVTQFSTWKTDGSKMRKRVDRALEFLSEADIKILRGKHPAINIGVMGWSQGSPQVIDDWEEMTVNLAGQHIADEIACQVIYHRHPHIVVDSSWNESCFYHADDIKRAKILHYHGNKHTSLERPSSRLWLKHLSGMIQTNRLSGMKTYLGWGDKALSAMMKDNPEWMKRVGA